MYKKKLTPFGIIKPHLHEGKRRIRAEKETSQFETIFRSHEGSKTTQRRIIKFDALPKNNSLPFFVAILKHQDIVLRPSLKMSQTCLNPCSFKIATSFHPHFTFMWTTEWNGVAKLRRLWEVSETALCPHVNDTLAKYSVFKILVIISNTKFGSAMMWLSF
jgi:hypothetical protein